MGTTEATLRMENVDAKEEWQDEGLPRYSFPISASALAGGEAGVGWVPTASLRWGLGDAGHIMNTCQII